MRQSSVTFHVNCDLVCRYVYFFVLLLQGGWTALHCSARYNRPEIIKVLISNGAKITVVDKV